MTWDVPTAEDCPKCGFSMFKKSGRGRMKPFCINETCENFLPEDQRGYYKKKTAAEGEEPASEEAGETAKPAKKTAKKTAEKKPAAKKSAAKKPSAKKTTQKKTTTGKKKEAAE